MGSTMMVTVQGYRAHAQLWENGAVTLESFNVKSSVYQDIKKRKKNYPVCDPRHGYSWLMWVPAAEKYGLFHPSTSTARPISNVIFDYFRPIKDRETEMEKDLPHTAVFLLGSEFITPKKPGSVPFWKPTVSPQENDGQYWPDQEKTIEITKKFMEPVLAEKPGTEDNR